MTKKYEVKLRQGSRISGDPVEIHEALESIRAKNGGNLTADMVVQASKSKRHPLHKYFDWQDASAAMEWRKHQARVLIGSIEVVYTELPKTPVRKYEFIETPAAQPDEPRGVYMATDEAANDPAFRKIMLAQAIRDAAVWMKRYAALSEFSQVFAEVQKVIAKNAA